MFRYIFLSLFALLCFESRSHAEDDPDDLDVLERKAMFLESQKLFDEGIQLTPDSAIFRSIEKEGYNSVVGECLRNITIKKGKVVEAPFVQQRFSLLAFQKQSDELFLVAGIPEGAGLDPLRADRLRGFKTGLEGAQYAFEFNGASKVNDSGDLTSQVSFFGIGDRENPSEPSRTIIVRGVKSGRPTKFGDYRHRPLFAALISSVEKTNTNTFKSYQAFCTYYDRKLLVKNVFSN